MWLDPGKLLSPGRWVDSPEGVVAGCRHLTRWYSTASGPGEAACPTAEAAPEGLEVDVWPAYGGSRRRVMTGIPNLDYMQLSNI